MKEIKPKTKSFILSDELVVHIIDSCFKDKYLVIHETLHENFNVELLTQEQILDQYEIKLDVDIDILKHARNILHERSEEKERQYGPFAEGMERAAQIASGMTGRQWSSRDMYIALIALKFSRESYNAKYDNMLDAIVYMAGLVKHEKPLYDETK